MEPVERNSGEAEYRASYRLERVRPRREVLWRVQSAPFQHAGIVANDGAYVVTAGRSFDAVTVRNSAGAVIREIAAGEIVSIAERLAGATWGLAALDFSQRYLALEVLIDDDAFEKRRALVRRVQLMDGRVLDPPHTPPGFVLPRLACDSDSTLARRAYEGRLLLDCITRGGEFAKRRVYELAGEQLRLTETSDRGEDLVRIWSRGGSRKKPFPCEEIRRDGELVSERCGPEVLPPQD